MRDINVLKVYNLVNSKGDKVQLCLGVQTGKANEIRVASADQGYRWSFVGKHIPMPVRSRCWFNGFPEPIMLDWLKGNGWYPRSCVSMCDGNAIVYELPDVEPSKGNEEPVNVPTYVKVAGEQVFKEAICNMCNNANKMAAVNMYRYLFPCGLRDAANAIEAIWLDKQP